MTFNFSILATDQIINSAAKMLYMSGGQFKIPIVFRGPGGSAFQAMRHILINRAKARVAKRRGGAEAVVTLDEEAIAADRTPEALLDLNEALDRLADLDPRLARVVECRFFGGLSEDEIAEALGITVRTVQRDWAKARRLLRRALAE
jgi:RNA polymerase sigma factor (TIGR02999 family)